MTQICGLLGTPISHSISPALHNGWFQKSGIDARYKLFELASKEDVKGFLSEFLLQPQSLGLNITVPYKSLVTQLGIECDEFARDVGAANTLYKNAQSEWRLGNTDVYGLMRAVDSMKVAMPRTALALLGAGGAAKATLVGAHRLGCRELSVFCRDKVKAQQELSNLSHLGFSIHSFEHIHKLTSVDSSLLIVNALPLGFIDDEPNQFALKALEVARARGGSETFFLDLIYAETTALMQARTLGMKASSGHVMLIEQARESFFLWTGQRPA